MRRDKSGGSRSSRSCLRPSPTTRRPPLDARRRLGRALSLADSQPPPTPPTPPTPSHASNDASSGGIGRQCAPSRAHPLRTPPPPFTPPPSLCTDSGPLRSLSSRSLIAADANRDRTRGPVAR
ncbi:hypothetical protein EV121DRAFT_297987 [Schizophyllum commune]